MSSIQCSKTCLYKVMWHSTAITFITFLLFTKCNGKSYRDHSLVHVIPSTSLEVDFFNEFEQLYNVTFWKKPSLVNKPIEFSISRLDFAELLRDTNDMNIDFHTVIRDLQSAFANQTIKPYVRRRMETFDWENYYSVEDIYSWLKDLSEMYPNELQLLDIGQSVQNRHILAVKVKLKGSNARSKVIVEGGCHAREWISPAFVTYMIHTILNVNNSTSEELKAIAYSHEWFFIPLLNPDGYSYSQTTDRLWRKNYHGSYGVDLNRNFGIGFGKHGASKDKQDSEFCGDAPFSEPETLAVATFTRENSNNLKYYLSFHSYGQYLIIPYAFEKEHLDNFMEVKKLADQVATRSSTKFGAYYHVGTAYDTVGYFASGISADWVKKSIDVPYVLTIELPDQGNYGFALPRHLIQSTCVATMDSLIPFLLPDKDGREKLRLGMPNGIERNKDFEDLLYCYAVCLFLLGLNIRD